MAEQGLMAPLPLILQPCSESWQLDIEPSLPDAVSLQVGGLHIQEVTDDSVRWVSAHLLPEQYRVGCARQVKVMWTTQTLQGVCRANTIARRSNPPVMHCLTVL